MSNQSVKDNKRQMRLQARMFSTASLEMRSARRASDERKIALQAARPTSETSSYPSDFIDLNDRMNDHKRNAVYGLVTDKQRDILAAGIPYVEITPKDALHSVSRAQFDLDAPERYRKLWAEIEAEQALPSAA